MASGTFSGKRAGQSRFSFVSEHQPFARNVRGVILWDGCVTASRWLFYFRSHCCMRVAAALIQALSLHRLLPISP